MKRKMIGAAAAYMSGLFFALFFTDTAGILMYSSAAVLVFLYGRRKGFRAADHIIIAVSFTAAVIVSFSYTALCYDRIIAYDGQTGSFSGAVTDIRHSGERFSYTLKGRINGETPAKICFSSDKLNVRTGDMISIPECSFYRPENSYLADSERIYRSRHIYLRADTPDDLTIIHTNKRRIKRALEAYRDRMTASFRDELGSDCGGFLAGMVFGDKSDFDDNTRTVLYRTGIGHVLAVSGLHVSILIGLLWALLSRLNVNRFCAFAVVNVMLLLLTAMANYPVSALRAALMLDIMYSAQLFRRQNDSFNSLAVAALIIAVSDPYCVLSAGFLLSLSGTFGVAVFAPYMTKKMERETSFQRLRISLVTGICTTLAVFPVSLWFFDETSLIAPFANLLLLPLCTAALLTGFIYVLTFGALPILPLAGNVIRTVLFISDKLTAPGIFHISDPDRVMRAIMLTAAAVVTAAHMFRKDRRLTAFLTAAGIVIFSAASAVSGVYRSRRWTVAVLGGGSDAAVVMTHRGHTCIADLSGSKRSAAYVRKYLMTNGVISADTVILTKNADSEQPLYEQELSIFNVKEWVSSDSVFSCKSGEGTMEYDSGILRVSCPDIEIAFVPASDGNAADCYTVFYGRYKKNKAPVGNSGADNDYIDLYSSGNNIEFTAANDGLRIRRL